MDMNSIVLGFSQNSVSKKIFHFHCPFLIINIKLLPAQRW